MISSVDEILQRNNLNYPTNFPLNELNLYLYGLPILSSADNRLILLATINFIKSTNRFSHQVLLPIFPFLLARSILLFCSFLFVCYVLIPFHFIQCSCCKFSRKVCGLWFILLCHAPYHIGPVHFLRRKILEKKTSITFYIVMRACYNQ